MPEIKLAEQPQFPLPTNVPCRGGMMFGYGNELKDGAGVDDPLSRQDVSTTFTVERIARVLAGIPAIGSACRALEAAGWHATIAGNRITVDYEVFVQFIAASVGQFGHVDASWVIYTVAGTPPVWIVGAECGDGPIG